MRQALVNENKDLCDQNHASGMRITGSDMEEHAELGNFIGREARYPVFVAMSKLVSTGADAQTCHLIVLERAEGSMADFKQIVGRGTRVHRDTRQFYFPMTDFRGATNHFANPAFDGEPVHISKTGEDDPIIPSDAVPSSTPCFSLSSRNSPPAESRATAAAWCAARWTRLTII